MTISQLNMSQTHLFQIVVLQIFTPNFLQRTMHFTALFGIVLAVSASASKFLYDDPHHTHEVLDFLHKTPHCAYRCVFKDEYKNTFAPECTDLAGKEFGACVCRANACQYIIDQCVERSCSP